MALLARIKDMELHEHELELRSRKEGYICSGCKEEGADMRFECVVDSCSGKVHYHTFCARRDNSQQHRYFSKCLFTLNRSIDKEKYCNACGQDINGFLYSCNVHCRKQKPRGRALHPWCFNLKRTLRNSNDPNLTLDLVSQLSKKCIVCDRIKCSVEVCDRGKMKIEMIHTWGYKTRNGQTQVHVKCMKGIVAKCWAVGYFGSSEEFKLLPTAEEELRDMVAALKEGRTSRATSRKGNNLGVRDVLKIASCLMSLFCAS